MTASVAGAAASGSRPCTVAEIPGAGRGLVAARVLRASDEVLRVPRRAWWPCGEAARSALLQHFTEERPEVAAGDFEAEDLSDEAAVALWLCGVLCRAHKQSPPEAPLGGAVDATPQLAAALAALPDQGDTVLQWSEEEFAELAGSSFFQAASELREETELEWQALAGDQAWSALVAGWGCDRERFEWAKAMVLSRQVNLECSGHPPGGANVVVPGHDLLNHCSGGDPNCEFDTTCADGAEGDDVAVVVRCTRDVDAGHELQISYGPLPNSSLLLFHGFVADANPYDCVELLLECPVVPAKRPWLRGLQRFARMQDDRNAANAFQVVDDPGDEAPAGAHFKLRHNLFEALPLPASFLGATRLLALPLASLESLAARAGDVAAGDAACKALCRGPGELPVPGEGGALELAASQLEQYVAAYPTSEGDDAAMLAAAAPGLADRRRQALLVRLAEKRILGAALQALRSAIGPA